MAATKGNRQGEANNAKNCSRVDIVLKVYLHCEQCTKLIVKCLRGFPGVEEINTDLKDHKVVVKGAKDVDPKILADRLVKKCNKQVEIISPKPKDKNVVEQKKIEPKIIQIILSLYVHCENCGKRITYNIEKMAGVHKVEVDAKKSQAIVKGEIEPQKLLEYVNNKMGKQATILKVMNETRLNNNEKKQGSQNEKNKTNNGRSNKKGEGLDRKQLELLYQFQCLSDENTQACTIM